MDEVYRQIMKRAPEHDFDPSLERMRYCLDLLGNPQSSFKTIHITGTNGKGSTARLAEALIRTSGLRSGLYTSPHLERVNERIAIDGQQVSDERFVDLYEQVIDFVLLTDKHFAEQDGPAMSFFEVLTIMAIWAFADAPVDVAVIEVGMGGLWDATNVIDADAAIIGPIGMDHMQWLGDTIEQIATEKAGIIKSGSTVILGPQSSESAERIVVDRAYETSDTTLLRDGTELEVVSRMPAVGGQLATLRTPNGEYSEVPISLFGEHQAHNALAALAAAEVVLPFNGPIDGDVVAEAFGGVKVPGRIEVVRSSPTILIDGGHNVQAVTALRAAIEENFDFKQVIGVVSMMADKQVEEVLGILEPLLDQIIVTQNSEINRVMPYRDLEKIAVTVFGRDRVIPKATMPDAIAAAVDLVDTDDDLGVGYGHGILITGSFVTAGDARMLLKEEPNKDLLKKKSER